MFNKVLVFLFLIGAVTAQLESGLYRILSSGIDSLGYVAESGYHPETPVTLQLSETTDLHELVSLLVTDMLIEPVFICDASSG